MLERRTWAGKPFPETFPKIAFARPCGPCVLELNISVRALDEAEVVSLWRAVEPARNLALHRERRRAGEPASSPLTTAWISRR